MSYILKIIGIYFLYINCCAALPGCVPPEYAGISANAISNGGALNFDQRYYKKGDYVCITEVSEPAKEFHDFYMVNLGYVHQCRSEKVDFSEHYYWVPINQTCNKKDRKNFAEIQGSKSIKTIRANNESSEFESASLSQKCKKLYNSDSQKCSKLISSGQGGYYGFNSVNDCMRWKVKIDKLESCN